MSDAVELGLNDNYQAPDSPSERHRKILVEVEAAK